MKIIFFLPAGTIEWKVPPEMAQGSNFMAFTTNVRANGFFVSPDMYLRHDAVIGMVYAPDEEVTTVEIKPAGATVQ